MTIKAKLTLNVMIVLAVIVTVVVASVIGMGFVKSKLRDLTERSTPFQTRTMELQRAIHAATASLVKVGSATTQTELRSYRSDAEASLGQVKIAEETVEALTGRRMDTHDGLSAQGRGLLAVTEERLALEQGAIGANNEVRSKLKNVVERLRGLDEKARSLQSAHGTVYGKSLQATNAINERLREMEALKLRLKNLQIWCYEFEKIQEKGSQETALRAGSGQLVMIQAQVKKVFKGSKNWEESISEQLSGGEKSLQQIGPLKEALLERPTAETRSKYEEVLNDLLVRLNLISTIVESEAESANETFSSEAREQQRVFGQVGKAMNVLQGSSALTSLGLSIEGLATRLFTVNSVKEVDEVQKSLAAILLEIDKTATLLDKALGELGAKTERKTLSEAMAGIASMKDLLFSQDGIIGKVRRQLAMKEKAAQVMATLRQTVLREAEEAKKTMTNAKGVQEQSIIDVNRMVRLSTLVVVAIGILAIVFGIGFGAWIYRSISGPLTRLIGVADGIASGNLSCEIVESARDEVGRVEASMAKMVANLRDIAGKIRSATESLAISSEELSATARSLDVGSEEQSVQVEQSVGAITEMSQTTEEVSKNASHTAVTAQSMKKMAIDGKETAHSSGKELARFVETVNESSKQIESLGKNSEEIHNIVDLIKEIADQTNLLALNAAIEAARAGEHGRGFAVVADNVRELAEKTMAATDSIEQMIRRMQGEIYSSVERMQGQKQSVTVVSAQVGDTLSAMDGIVSYVENVTDMVDRIAAAMTEQSATSSEVSQSMERIALVTRQLRSSAATTRDTAEELSKIASGLNQTTGWFKA